MEYYTSIIKDKPERLVLALGAIAAAGLSAYATNRALTTTKKSTTGYDEIPTPPGALYQLGHLIQLGANPALKITEWHRKYGPILRVKMGVQNWIFISDPEIAQDVFATQGSLTSGRPFLTFGNGISGAGGRGIVFVDYGKKWKNARHAIMNILSLKSVNSFDKPLQEEAEKSLNLLIEKSKSDGFVFPLPYVRLYSVNLILATGFGIPGLTSPEDPLYKELIHIIEEGLNLAGVVSDISAYLPAMSFLDVLFRRERQMKNFVENVRNPMFAKLIQRARESDNDNLVKKLDNIKEELEIDEQNINVMMYELLVAGGDTVAITTTWTYAHLCLHPEAQKKLQAEIDEFIAAHHRMPTFADRLELPYYNSFQKECIRVSPIVFFTVPRKSNQDVIYKNYVLEKDTVMVCNMHTIHTDSKTFEEPEKFIPERFLDETRSMYACANGSIQSRDQFIFGFGRRICPGIALAENELFNSITKAMARCTIEPFIAPNGEKVLPDLTQYADATGATVRPLPFKIRFVERENRVKIE